MVKSKNPWVSGEDFPDETNPLIQWMSFKGKWSLDHMIFEATNLHGDHGSDSGNCSISGPYGLTSVHPFSSD